MVRRMAVRPPRSTLIPNANNPRLLARLLELVGQGVRDPRTLAELLDCELRTVHYYTQAGDWLGLLDTDERTMHPFLTALGLEYVFGGTNRARVYAEAVWRNRFVHQLMVGRNLLPETPIIANAIQQAVPGMAGTTARRRASAVRSLLEPAMRYPRVQRPPAQQLALDFGAPPPPPAVVPPPLDLRAGVERSPHAYRVVLRALLDHGELSLGQLRAVLDRQGGQDCPVGSYVEMALRRGDAWRVGERIITSFGAVWRRDVADSALAVALSDPGWRGHLEVVFEAATGELRARDALRRSSPAALAWDRALFPEATTAEQLSAEVERVLLSRNLDNFPMAGESGPKPAPSPGSFLSRLEDSELAIALPPNVADLTLSIEELNRRLEVRRRGPNAVLAPSMLDRREVVHGGLFAPGEAPVPAIPDRISLRLRALECIPHLAMLAALLIAHRRQAGRIVLKVTEGAVLVRVGHQDRGELLALLDEFASEQGWLVSRRPRSGLDSEALLQVLERLGVCVSIRGCAVMAEPLFVRLQDDPEHHELYRALLPLADRLGGFLEEL